MPTTQRRAPRKSADSAPSEPRTDAQPESVSPDAEPAESRTELLTAVAPPNAELDAIDRLRAARHEALLRSELAPNIHECMAIAMRKVRPVGKEGYNKSDGYGFKRIDDFMDSANGALAEAGVHIVPRVLQRLADDSHNTRGGSIYRWIDLEVRFRFYGPRGDHFDVITWGEGRDASDKATNKALTAAMKYALMYALMIPTSDIQDADRESPQHERTEQPQQQRPRTDEDDRIAAMIERADADADTVRSFRADALRVADEHPVGKERHDALQLVWRMAGNAGALGCEVTLPAPWQAVAGMPTCTLHQLLVGAQQITVPSGETEPVEPRKPADPSQPHRVEPDGQQQPEEDPWATGKSQSGAQQ